MTLTSSSHPKIEFISGYNISADYENLAWAYHTYCSEEH